VTGSRKAGLSRLVISAKIHRIRLVPGAQAKFTRLGSAATFGFLQAMAASA